MLNDSTHLPSTSKSVPTRPSKPHPDFPLYAHKVGCWAKKVKGKTRYFGKWAEDPKGVVALEMWLKQKDRLLAGLEPHNKDIDVDALKVEYLCNRFLLHHEERRDNGEISPRTFQGLHATCVKIVGAFGKQRAVTDLKPDDFGDLKAILQKTRKAEAMRSEMQRVRAVFKYAFTNREIPQEVRYGTKFEKPKKKQVRRERREHREKHGMRMFEALEIRQVLAEAKQPMTAMTLVAINCGFGQTDLARIPISSVDLDAGMIDFPRPKTEASRICPLWPETVEAIRAWLPLRPKAKDTNDTGLLFLTCRGNRFVKTGTTGMPTDGIGQEFVKLLRRLNLKRPGLSFYGLRHSFRTVADETLDPVAIDLIMGHVDTSMASHYRERVSDERLKAVTDYVHDWLFVDTDNDSTDPKTKTLSISRKSAVKPAKPDDNDSQPTLRLFVG